MTSKVHKQSQCVIAPTKVHLRTHFERPRGNITVFARPNLFDEIGIGSGDLPLHAQRVVLIQFVRVFVFEEVLREWRDIT